MKALLLGAAVLLIGVGCEADDNCNELVPDNGLAIAIPGPLADGAYSAKITVDGLAPVSMAWTVAGGAWSCERCEGSSTGPEHGWLRVRRGQDAGGRDAWVVSYVQRGEPAGAPERVAIAVSRGDDVVALGEFEPTYVVDEIDGTSCVATRASVEVGPAGSQCTRTAWHEGLNVRLTRPDGAALAPGDYEVRVEADGQPIAIQFTPGQAPRPAGSVPFLDHGDMRVHIALRGDTVQVHYTKVGANPTPTGPIGLFGGPSAAVVIVTRDGVEIARQSYQPSYTHGELNGPGCGFATHATVNLALP